MSNPTPIPLDEWLPDKSDRTNPTAEAKGVYSVGGQYAPFPDIQNYGPASTIDSYTKVLLHMDGADATNVFPDDAPSVSHTWTPHNGAVLDTADSKFGGASLLLVSASSQYLTCPDSADFTLGSGDFTLDCWFKCTLAGGTFQFLVSQSDAGGPDSSIVLFRSNTNVIVGAMSTASTDYSVTGTTQFTSTANTGWHHVALVRSGTSLMLFVDGIQEGGTTTVAGAVNDSAYPFTIGARADLTGFWGGWMDEVRLSVGINRYSAYTDNPDTYTKVLLHMNGADTSTLFPGHAPTAHTWTANGSAQVDTAQSKFGGASLLLNVATSDYISTPDSADYTLGSSDFTIDCWFKVAGAAGVQQMLAGQGTNIAAVATTAWWIDRQTANTMRALFVIGTTPVSVASTTTVTDSNWHHIAVARSGNTLRLFLDGVQEGGDVSMSGTVNDAATVLSIGQMGSVASVQWTGWIDEFRLSVGVARWSANFTPPTAAYNQGFATALPTRAYNYGGGAANVVLGADTFYDSDTDPHVFFGDSSRLYTLESRQSEDVSKSGGYAVGDSDTWQFAQFGDHVMAVSSNVAPQHYVMGTSVDFANLAGGPPTGATSVARVGDFGWMGKDYTVYWSAFNDVTDWAASSVTQAGSQQLDQERGEIMCLVGLDYAAIFQERAIRRAIYVGSPVVWDFGQDYVEKARGAIARNAAIPWGRLIFYCSDDGFYAFDGQASTPIGYGKVDDYFRRNLNYAFRHKISAGIDYARKLCVFGFPAGSAQLISELLIFSIQDGRWTHDVIDLEFLFDTPAEPLTVDNFSLIFPADDLDGTIVPDDIDSTSFDDRRIKLAAFQTTTHAMGLFTGAARPATMDTKEFEPLPGRRGLVTEVWPLGDYPATSISSSLRYRKALPADTILTSNPTNMNRAGYCPQRTDARFIRVRQQVTAGADWRRAEAVHVTSTPTGGR